MSVYVVVDALALDQERVLEYRRLAESTIDQYGGRYHIQGATPQPAEGQWPEGRVMTVIEFPDMAQAQQWYHSPEYQAAKQAREGAIDVRLLFVEGGRAAPLADASD
ncbi:DUF1330 domain-containing protein [Nocardia transvalensis]|uniref:DUF1330 domain-containing protein n=1 Tax=Nocardia transvalensis TaxID=37333 RepID=UPI00189546CF|nr:DUF1330 domain-containing protein [Nocardia transvalensis]MBF6328052.1 DUF1330 domain-containing protein [Nocardia transvalensis]